MPGTTSPRALAVRARDRAAPAALVEDGDVRGGAEPAGQEGVLEAGRGQALEEAGRPLGLRAGHHVDELLDGRRAGRAREQRERVGDEQPARARRRVEAAPRGGGSRRGSASRAQVR